MIEKFKLFSVVIIIYAIFSIATVRVANCQEIDLVSIVQEIPDSLFDFEADFVSLMFTKEVRNKLFQNPYYNDSITEFSVSSKSLKGVEEDINIEYDPIFTYSVSMFKNLNWINFIFYGDFYAISSDFFLIPENDSYSFILLKEYSDNIGTPSVREVFSYYFDRKANKYVKKEISLPELDWIDYYTAEDVTKLNMDCLKGLNPIYSISFFEFDNEIVMSTTVDLEGVATIFLNTIDNNYRHSNDIFENKYICYDSLGFRALPDALPKFYTFPDFVLLNNQEFDIAYLFDSFCERKAQNWDLDFFYNLDKDSFDIKNQDAHYNLIFSDSLMSISSKMLNVDRNMIDILDVKAVLLNIDAHNYFVICYNSIGTVSESQVKVFKYYESVLYSELSYNIHKKFTNNDFGIDYPENVFDKFPEVFSLKYNVDNDSLRITMQINPPIVNKDEDEIIIQIEKSNIEYKYAWSDLLKKSRY